MTTHTMHYCIALCTIVMAAHGLTCVTFEHGLCAGPANCMCSFGSVCDTAHGKKVSTQSVNTTEWVATKKRELEAQGMVANCASMGGTCYLTSSGHCPNSGSTCMAYTDACGGSTSPPPPPPPPPATSTSSTPPPPPPPSTGYYGLDIALWVNPTAAQWSCMKSNYDFAVIEVWNGGSGLRTNIATAVANARAAGFTNIDVYAFMCNNCNNPAKESVTKVVNAIAGTGVGRVWIDVEQCTKCWSTNLNENADYVHDLVTNYTAQNVPVGIYTSPGEWPMTVGSDSIKSTQFKGLPLWYANYDAAINFNDWKNGFGGWGAPHMKQFADSASNTCSVSVDRNWRPTANI